MIRVVVDTNIYVSALVFGGRHSLAPTEFLARRFWEE